jgi:hypothetical protein
VSPREDGVTRMVRNGAMTLLLALLIAMSQFGAVPLWSVILGGMFYVHSTIR